VTAIRAHVGLILQLLRIWFRSQRAALTAHAGIPDNATYTRLSDDRAVIVSCTRGVSSTGTTFVQLNLYLPNPVRSYMRSDWSSVASGPAAPCRCSVTAAVDNGGRAEAAVVALAKAGAMRVRFSSVIVAGELIELAEGVLDNGSVRVRIVDGAATVVTDPAPARTPELGG
jgi:hypothetical protein